MFKEESVMNTDEILELFQKDKLLVRAMDYSDLSRKDGDKSAYYRNFDVWAKEVDMSLHNKLTSISSTLLVAGERIPTYKNIGFIINSDKAEILHVSDVDSGSSGDAVNGDFYAIKSDLSTLFELADKTRKEKLTDMNEVNVSIGNDAIVGLFVDKAVSDLPKSHILLAQEYYKMHTGKELPIFVYDSQKGDLQPLKMSEEDKKDFLLSMESRLKTLTIGYELYNTHEIKQKTLYKNTGSLKETLSKLLSSTEEKPQIQPTLRSFSKRFLSEDR